eukprot:4922052-Prymnesium_polylepis.1
MVVGTFGPPVAYGMLPDVERQLKRDLLSITRYDNSVPPAGPAQGMGVQVGVSISAIKPFAMDLMAQRMRLFGWLRMEWTDARLVWDPAEWGGIEHITALGLPADLPVDGEGLVWVPDIDLYNEESTYDITPKSALVRYDGSVSWSRNSLLPANCNLTGPLGLQNFPYDQ